MNSVSVVIPAHNEAKRIRGVIDRIDKQAFEVIVIDDGSSDNTGAVAKRAGARVVHNFKNLGYLESTKKGFREARGEVIVTMDADGEHDPRDIPRLLEPIQRGEADLVMGRREKREIRISERLLSWISAWKTGIQDSGTGFRALRRDLALDLKLNALCPCGVLTLEAHHLGARLAEVPITLGTNDKKRSVAWTHFRQFLFLIESMIE